MIKLLLLAAASVGVSYGLSCFCGSSPCQTPVCCESGQYTLDSCGCCLTCAKDDGQKCGGPFRTEGRCAGGLRCLRKCECKSNLGNNCVFPFTFKGETHNKCTTSGSDNGAPWCATEVDADGEVVRNKWEDCEEGCPGTDFECNEGFLFNVEGECVNGTDAPGILEQLQRGPLAVTLDDIPSETNIKRAPFCPVGKSAKDVHTCRCTKESTVKGLDGNPKGGCVPPLNDIGIEDLEYGWCFLENVEHPENPTENCYEDVDWSAADGRFWSNLACVEEHKKPTECLTTLQKPCVFPFSYNDVVHTECTHVGSENGAAWCATQVDSEGVVVRNTWEDCQAGCPVEEEVILDI